MKILKSALALALVICACQSAAMRLPRGSNTVASQFSQSLPLGGGGWLVEGDVADDGQIIAVTDTYGAWLRAPGSTTFNQIINCNAMPVGFCGYFPATGAGQLNQQNGPPSALAACPQNSAIIYMMYNGYVFKSTDHAAHWARQASFNGGTQLPQAVNGPYRFTGRKAACDPHNTSHAYISTDANGLFETNDGGTTWAAIPTGAGGIPASTGDSGSNTGSFPNYNIAFDASSGSAFNCGPNSNNTCKIYVANYVNVSGTLSGKLYASINGGTSWTATAGGPNTFGHLIVSALDGLVWMTDRRTATDQGGVWKYSGGTAGTFTDYTASTGSSQHSIAADRVTSGKLYASDVFGNVQTVTSNTSWGANFGHTQTATDIPWLAWTNDFGLSNGDTIIDPTTNNLVLFAGIAVWSTPTSSLGATFSWNSITKAIEQMDAQAIKPLPNGNVAVGVQDRSIFVLTPGTYPSTQQTTYQNGVDLAVGSDVDFAKSDPTHMAAIMMPWGGTPSFSGFSADSGATWKPFNSFYQTYPVSAIALDGSNQWKISVSHADALALTNWTAGPPASGSIVRIIGVDAEAQPQGMRLGPSWPVSVDTVGNTVTLLGSNEGVNISKAASGSFMMYVDTNALTNRNGKYNITNVTNNGSGLIRLTITSNDFSFGSQVRLCVSGSFGVPNAIGCWVGINVNPNSPGTIDLYGSTFAGAYTSGGVVTGPMGPGGAIAQSTPNNIIIIPQDRSYPLCTLDGGLTWAELQIPASTVGTFGTDTGWGTGHFFIRHEIAADPVSANTFYAYNYVGGVYKIVNCTVQNSGNPASGSQLNSGIGGYTAHTQTADLFLFSEGHGTLANVPGNAGHLFWAGGPQGTVTGGPGSVPLYRSTDGGQNWFTIPNVSNPISVSCGAIKPGATYPTCFVVGWVDTGGGYVYGIFRSTNADQATPTWTKVDDYPAGGNEDQVYLIAADLNIWNRWYVGFGGSSFAYGQQN